MRSSSMLALASLALLVGCSSTPPASDVPLEPQIKLGDTWERGRSISTLLRAKDRTVAVTVSAVLLNDAGVLCRVVSVSDVFDPDKFHSGSTQGVQEVDIRRADKVGSSGYGYTTSIHPRSNLTWGDVASKDDFVLDADVP